VAKKTMKQFESSKADATADKAEAKRGIKEGSKADIAADKKGLARMNKGKK
jgi:hypothetical protein